MGLEVEPAPGKPTESGLDLAHKLESLLPQPFVAVAEDAAAAAVAVAAVAVAVDLAFVA